MLPLALVAVGLLALVTGIAVLRSLGPGYRIGRILAAAPRVEIAEARRIAATGERRYVGIDGRIDSEDEFEDAAHRPLVYRRTRLEARLGRRWTRFEESVETVPFDVRDGSDGIAIDGGALDSGLVVISRESRGVVRDLAERAPASLPPDAPARATIDQVSSVEHATVLGWPSTADDGRPVMTAGLGRPLVLTTLDVPEAMRVLARGERARPRLAAASLVLGATLVALGLVLGALTALGVTGPLDLGAVGTEAVTALDAPRALAADPGTSGPPGQAAPASPVPSGLSGDTRSSGEGPGLVGAPGAAILTVLGIGAATALLTVLYVRATGGPRVG